MLERVPHDCLSSSAASPSQQVLADVIDRVAARLRSGERVDYEHEARQYSEIAEELRLLLPTLEVLALARGSQRDRSAHISTPAPETSGGWASQPVPSGK